MKAITGFIIMFIIAVIFIIFILIFGLNVELSRSGLNMTSDIINLTIG